MADELVGDGWVPDELLGWRLDVWWATEYGTEGRDADPAPYSLRDAANPAFPAKHLKRILAELM